jgi:hypothetical protein
VGHNLLNAHAAAVQRYRTAYQDAQQGEIGIVLNLDWGEPLTRSYLDNSAAVRHNEFQLGWFGDPIFFGRYPDSMRRGANDEHSGSRMPEFSREQHDRLLGSVDFLGVNHYSTRYYMDGDNSPHNFIGNDSLLNEANRRKIRERGDLGTGWAFDQRTISTKYDLQGRLIGPQAESEWLNTVPWGFTNVLVYLHNRYSIAHSHLAAARSTSPAATATAGATVDGAEQKALRNPLAAQALAAPAPGQVSGLYESGRQRIPIYVTENGCDAPGEASKSLDDVLHDAFRYVYCVAVRTSPWCDAQKCRCFLAKGLWDAPHCVLLRSRGQDIVPVVVPGGPAAGAALGRGRAGLLRLESARQLRVSPLLCLFVCHVCV